MAATTAQDALGLLVDRLRLHSPLGDGEYATLTSLPARELVLGAHQPLARSGQSTSYAWLVVEGLVGRVAQTDDGLRQIQELFIPGDLANLSAMMLPARRCTLEAVTKSRVLGVPHAALLTAASAFRTIETAFAREALLSREILAQWLLNVGRRDARARVVHFLCEMAIRYRVASRGAGAEFILPMTQEQLGDALALTPVHINRTLKALREDGLVTMNRQRVTIHDWAALATAGEFDPSYLRVERLDEPQSRPSSLTSS